MMKTVNEKKMRKWTYIKFAIMPTYKMSITFTVYKVYF